MIERRDSHGSANRRFEEGAKIYNISDIMYTFFWSSELAEPAVFVIEARIENGQTGRLLADAVSIKDSAELPEQIIKSRWMHSYYLDVM